MLQSDLLTQVCIKVELSKNHQKKEAKTMVTFTDLLSDNVLILSTYDFYHFSRKFPFWDTFYNIENIKYDLDTSTGLLHTYYVLRKKFKYLNMKTQQAK